MMRYTTKSAACFGISLLVLCTFGACNRAGSSTDSPAANINGSAEKKLPDAGDANKPLMKADADPLHPVVVLETSLGNVTIKLDAEKSPLTVHNFLRYVNDQHYNQTIIHQVYQGQGVLAGGYDPKFAEKPTRMAVRNEARNGLKNVRKSISMVRFPDDADSATSQFFFNVSDNPSLDFRDETPEGYGYCVFGEVIDGMDVVDKMAAVQVHDTPDFERTPVEPIVIQLAKQVR